MTKPRGNKTSKAARAERQAKEIALMNEGKTQMQIAEELGISRATFWRDIQTLTTQYAEGNQQAFAELRKVQVGALLDMAHEVRDGVITPETGNSVRGFLDSVSRLLGLNAESKSLVLHGSTNPEHSREYLLFREACAGLDEDQVHEVYKFAKSLPRTWVAPPIEVNFPKALPEETE